MRETIAARVERLKGNFEWLMRAFPVKLEAEIWTGLIEEIETAISNELGAQVKATKGKKK